MLLICFIVLNGIKSPYCTVLNPLKAAKNYIIHIFVMIHVVPIVVVCVFVVDIVRILGIEFHCFAGVGLFFCVCLMAAVSGCVDGVERGMKEAFLFSSFYFFQRL